MPPEHQPQAGSSASATKKEHSSHGHKDRIGNYHVGAEIGRGSFATVYKGYRSKTKEPIAIKAVSRQKLTAKLLENLESEINILKAISHRNIVSLEDCFKNDTHIYLVMEYCTGSDLSIYIKNRGKLPTLDFVPRPSMFLSGPVPQPSSTNEGESKVYWPHPSVGGIDERVTRCFLGQLALALQFLRSQDLIHRDIKPQNLLLQPATAAELADGHPLGIPVLKVADFGFARILPAAAMAETLCGSPLYMAPEILRYEKYDAKADLWSVGAVLFEMAVGRPPFRANNHVELLRKIERGEDRIKFPDESSRQPDPSSTDPIPVPPNQDIKQLIRRLLKRIPKERMDFENFFNCGIWDGYMTELTGGGQGGMGGSSEEESSLSPDLISAESSFEASRHTKRSLVLRDKEREREREEKERDIERERKLREAVEADRARLLKAEEENMAKRGESSGSGTQEREGRRRIRQPTTDDPALNSTPAPLPKSPSSPTTETKEEKPILSNISTRPIPPFVPIQQTSKSSPAKRSEPKYYVSDEAGPFLPPLSPSQPTISRPPLLPQSTSNREVNARPIEPSRRLSSREAGSMEDPPVITPSSSGLPPLHRNRVSEGSPLASTPPLTMRSEIEETGKDQSALDGSDSILGREYVVVEKQTVEVNALADELDQASRAHQALVRRPSSRTSIVTRPVSAFKPTSAPDITSKPKLPDVEQSAALNKSTSPNINNNAPLSYSPPFAMSTTPPFAINPATIQRQPSVTISRPSSVIPQSLNNIFPPAQISYSPENYVSTVSRFSSSPSSLQTGALARALTNTAIRMIGQGANTAATALARAATKKRPTIIRSGEMDTQEEELLNKVEDLARKSFVLFELADGRLSHWHALARRDPLASTTPPFTSASAGIGIGSRRKSSSSSSNSELFLLRQQELAAGEACVLYCKALNFIVKGTNAVQRFWETKEGAVGAGVELNEMVQWLRARFNECFEKAEWAKMRCADELPFVERLLHDKAREMSRQAAIAELQGDLVSADSGYENSLWLLMALLDETMYEGGVGMKDDDRMSVEKLINPIRNRMETLKRKMAESPSQTQTQLVRS